MVTKVPRLLKPVSRRAILKGTLAAGAGAGAMSISGRPPFGFAGAWAADEPAIGTWPAGSTGNSVTVSIAVPRTGTYAVQGEDELKGWQLAVEHMNSGHELMKKFSPKTTKGVLGKEVGEHAVPVFAREIAEVDRDAQAPAHRHRVATIVLGAAVAAAVVGPVVHEQAGHRGAVALQQQRRDRRIDAAGHADDEVRRRCAHESCWSIESGCRRPAR